MILSKFALVYLGIGDGDDGIGFWFRGIGTMFHCVVRFKCLGIWILLLFITLLSG